MRKKWIAGSAMSCALALGLLAGTAHAADNIVANGGFESGLASWTPSGFLLEGYDYGVGDIARSGTSAFYGGGVTDPGFLSQVLTTEVGTRYDVQLWLYSDGFLPNSFQVRAGGALLLNVDDDMQQQFGLLTTSFVATSMQTTLQFALRNDAGFLRVDDVSVSAMAAAVPEPQTYALMALGLGALALIRRRRAH
ncbi:MAG: hypothetical protein JWP52_2760 [Rhizobacter sp.]|nr:hypothetical protein [Rhizobacter sp.]